MNRARSASCCAALVFVTTITVAVQAQPPADGSTTRPSAAITTKTALGEGIDAARSTNYALAEKSLGAITGPDRPSARLALGHVMLEQGRWAEAEHYAVEAASSPAERLDATALRARILAAQGKVTEAIKLLTPEKDATGPAGRRVRLALGELLVRAGHRADAEPILLTFADDYDSDAISSSDADGLAMVGRAMHLLRHAKDANRAFNESERAERGRVEELLWRADLYLDKFDPGHAEEALEEALKIAPHRADALVLLARLKLGEALDFETADKLSHEALAINPKHVGAQAVRAGIALRDMNLPAANAAIDAGLTNDPNDLELLSLRAAAHFLADDKAGFDTAKREIFARNPEFSQAYGIIGEYAEWEHRYVDLIAMMRDAVALDPHDAKAWAALGTMQTRAGNEADGIKSLEEAWHDDHFNVRVYNTLQLLYRQWIPQQYTEASAGPFRIRYPKDEKAVLERYVPRMLEEAWGAMKMHYGFTPESPVAVEMYRERQHFSVRTSGLPNIGIQGVCFGKVVAAMSPGSEPFNWGNVLWHELAHVFAIQLSKNHVPRWFTEGLSEYETMIRRPEWQRELDPELYVALTRNQLPGALGMNSAFTHAEGELDVTVAYYAASQMLAFTAEQYGFSKIARALDLWGHGVTTLDVIPRAFGVTAPEYDARFRAWALSRLSRYANQYMFDSHRVAVDDARSAVGADPSNPTPHVRYALALVQSRQLDDARREVDLALKIDPGNRDAHYLDAKLATDAGDFEGATRHLRAIQASGIDGYMVEMALANAAEGAHNTAGRRMALEAATLLDPTQVEPLRALFDLANQEKRDADALTALRAVARLDQHDRQAWRMLLDRLVQHRLWDEAKRIGESALYVDIASGPIHSLYAQALAATGDHVGAAFELESALLCDGRPDERATLHARLARERFALGDASAARVHRDEALRLDPANAEARSLKP